MCVYVYLYSSLCLLQGTRSNDTLAPTSTFSDYSLIKKTKQKKTLGEMADPRSGQSKYKMSLDHLVRSESEEMFQIR